MVDKKEPAKGWPVVKGEYDAGDPKSPVAVATCGSHFNLFPIKAGASISGPFKTENLGIEKIVANIISNPNIRTLIICGSEVKGHISGDALIRAVQVRHQRRQDRQCKRRYTFHREPRRKCDQEVPGTGKDRRDGRRRGRSQDHRGHQGRDRQ